MAFEKLKEKIKIYSEITLFPFVIFTLPFTFIGAILARFTIDGRVLPSFMEIFWITAATISARNAGMLVNRLLDRDIDAKNPRARDRALVKGKISGKEVFALTLLSIGFFIFSAGMLNRLCLYLSPVPVLLLLGYPLTKRYTWLNHVVLGGVLFFAPVGGWIAVSGSWDLPATVLGLSVLFWSAGFDIIYDREDIAFYRSSGLYSLPQLLGEKISQFIALFFHLVTIALFVLLSRTVDLGIIYFAGVFGSAVLILYGHVSTYKVEILRTNTTFFWINALVSSSLFLSTLADLAVR